ncbi:MAG: phosphate regulon transcriptional regulator PhoB [Burkholderiales bacterium]|nr:phosphate regulon transcriptional regulator PhoB [Burkholderiales bacterium]
MAATVLVVEDEAAIQEMLAITLKQAGFAVLRADSAEAARSVLKLTMPDVVLVDWMLPGVSGAALAKSLRDSPRTRPLPIVMLTAKASEADKVAGLELGADDYITKPFSPRELIARIKAVLRRRSPHRSEEPVQVGGLRLDPTTHRVTGNGKPIALTPIEFRLLHYFMARADRVHSRSQLLDNVWGEAAYIGERTVDVSIRRLRLALDSVGLGPFVETVRGGGYLFNSQVGGLTQSEPSPDDS